MITVRRNENTSNWDVVFPDLTTRTFDGRFTESQVRLKASRYWSGEDSYKDGLYTVA